ncbi:MAG: hypothetical protein LBF63_06310, partial [Treponema sp.]|nr:hypothetical protein [Treponema sp.]
IRFGFQTWAEKGSGFGAPANTTNYTGYKATGFYTALGGSYQVTPWFKPWVWSQISIHSYEDGSNVAGKDPAAFDKFALEPGADFSLGNGLTIVPLVDLVFKTANGPSAGKDEAVTDIKFTVKLTYAF